MRNGKWRKIGNEDGYKINMKQIMISDKLCSVTIDNFTAKPFTIQDYDCQTLEIDKEWMNVFGSELLSFESIEEGLVWVKENLSHEYVSLRRWLKNNDYLEGK